ncbi:hypothetical protein BO78DRAFT_97633 [Aspergillus sclerotiicarbonarius CBS 121057]|uniref:GTP-binding protein 8 n=1 Tax=Aspergillus sclerotiicarbonarius (strain CBS 121057 / IBT 28362) TaxID=1448318 RepID=A0A319EMW0_ASPSB|nr:hypothetical protein BO78DRAFT_97633 [Aspergillus sclerotiicarbonarius CBS 121057]
MKSRLFSLTSLPQWKSPFPSIHRNLSTTVTPPSNPPPNPHPNKTLLQDLSPTALNLYWDRPEPTEEQLAYANKFFARSRHSPFRVWSAAKFRTTPVDTGTPEVAFLGRSNTGKSSLLNCIMDDKICYASSKPGRTVTMNAFGVGGTKGGESKVILLDMPGYGKGSRTEWGQEIMKYLKKRKQLRRAFIMIDGEHGIKYSDKEILELFRRYAIPHQVIVSKVDKILAKRKSQILTGVTDENILAVHKSLEKLRPIVQPTGRTEGPPALGELLTSSSLAYRSPRDYVGVGAIRWAILSAAGYDGTVEVKAEQPVSPDSTTSEEEP